MRREFIQAAWNLRRCIRQEKRIGDRLPLLSAYCRARRDYILWLRRTEARG